MEKDSNWKGRKVRIGQLSSFCSLRVPVWPDTVPSFNQLENSEMQETAHSQNGTSCVSY